ncbi:MAG: sigma-70 family RNA polymerase sigma factor [Phycisphaerales bacterium]|nr:sigma-70 family RNA polymerase sigma factor [Phycisphaerales bacterium]
MAEASRTTTALLNNLHEADNEAAWREFDERYRPILIGFSRRLGLPEADAVDVAQETMVQFIKEYREGKYDRDRGRLRSWLLGIARFRVAGIYRKRATSRVSRGESAIVDLPREAEIEEAWNTERRMTILRTAMEQLKNSTKIADKTVRAFEMVALQQQSVAAVAAELDISENDVYLAKSRVAAKLKEIVASIESLYDEDAV